MSLLKKNLTAKKSTVAKPSLVKPVAAKKPVAKKVKTVAVVAPVVIEAKPEVIAAPISGLFASLIPAAATRTPGVKKSSYTPTGPRKSGLSRFKSDIETARRRVPPFSYKEIAGVLNASLAANGEKEFVKVPAVVQFIRKNLPDLVKFRAVKEEVAAEPVVA